jgi:2-oxoglutarate dehydrogenase E2 component (dihydrolipoamide succinyltransferase)
MALVEMVMPKMGESIMEGTILKWLKNVGDNIKQDEAVLEVATDKVDTEVPSTYAGVLKEIICKEGEVVAVGKTIAIIETTGNEHQQATTITEPIAETVLEAIAEATMPHLNTAIENPVSNASNRFYSPLVMNIAREEKIGMNELEKIKGTGKDDRVTKQDIFDYLEARKKAPIQTVAPPVTTPVTTPTATPIPNIPFVKEPTDVQLKPASSYTGAHELIEMDRMRKIIAQRMLDSKRIAPHVTSFVEADVTNIVYWRNRMKQEFQKREGDTITLTPIFIEAIAKAMKDYPMMNVSVEGDHIVVKKDINIGMAVALGSGNLIVPVIKNVDQLNIVGITKKVNDLARRARDGKLTPDDLSDGTYTMSNVGSFGNVMGTPIIVQPQVGIMAFGAIQKKPAVIETEFGDAIAIRHLMYLSHSYDHRVVDGSLGGMFVRRVADYLEKFDVNRKIW